MIVQLTQEHQGFPSGTQFEGPKPIPGSMTNGYYPIGADPSSKFCFFESYVKSQPNLFKEITNQ